MADTTFVIGPDGSRHTLLPGGSRISHIQSKPLDPGVAQAQWGYGPAMANAMSGPLNAFAPSAANMFGTYADMMKGGAQTMGQMFGSYANAYGQYGNAIGNLYGNAANANANANADRYGAWASGLSGYNNMLGSLGASALGAYGSAANAAMQSQAMRESAYAKAMSDAIAANQAAVGTYGAGREAALASLGKSYSDTAGSVGQARGNTATAASNLGGAGATALSALGVGLGQNTANVAGNAMNYTRDMGKLDLARTLGIGQINALGSSTGGGVGLAGPNGLLGYGSYGGGSGYGAAMPQTPGWYSSGPQYYDGNGMSELAATGGASRQSVLDALNRGYSSIDDQTAGLNADSGRAFGGIDATRGDVTSSPVLGALTSGYGSGMQALRDTYAAGRADPASLLREVYSGASGLVTPFLNAGTSAWDQWRGGYPEPLPPFGVQDPMPFLQALQLGWMPYQTGLDRAMTQQNANILGILTSGQNTYNSSLGNLTNQYLGTMGAMRDAASRQPFTPDPLAQARQQQELKEYNNRNFGYGYPGYRSPVRG